MPSRVHTTGWRRSWTRYRDAWNVRGGHRQYNYVVDCCDARDVDERSKHVNGQPGARYVHELSDERLFGRDYDAQITKSRAVDAKNVDERSDDGLYGQEQRRGNSKA